MKYLKYFLTLTVTIVFAVACNEGIDPITYVAPGPDASAPVVNIISPTEGLVIDVDSLVTTTKIQVEVTDDIELGSIEFLMDGVKITEFSEFKDYRRALKEYMYKNVTLGNHVLSVRATDLQGKVTTKTVNFRRPPYVPIYAGEVFYMPFNGSYIEKITFMPATIVGSPGFTGEAQALKGLDAYKGATDSYLTFPTAGLTGSEFSATFWYKVNGSPDRSGILNASPAGEDRNKGFRLFREGSASEQRIKLNVGTGAGENWNDGQVITAPGTDWVHIAITISGTSAIIYVNGAVAGSVANTGLDWTGCDVFGIGSGAPNFIYWGHNSDLSSYDELRMFNKALTQAEIQTIMDNDFSYVPKYGGEVLYMPFEGTYKDLVSKTMATKVGTPGFATGKKGQAYAGATNSYLTYPTTEFVKSSNFSAVFWMKVNATPDRAGILTAGPEDLTNPGYPAVQNKRTSGFRFFREGSTTSQQFKVNVGSGAAESWNDGGTFDPSAGAWVHIAFTISDTKSIIYINGEKARESTLTTMDWTGCSLLSIMSGAPRFTEWSHLSDLSLMDELRIFNVALTQTEVQTIMNDEN